jgi:hypothetical protein
MLTSSGMQLLFSGAPAFYDQCRTVEGREWIIASIYIMCLMMEGIISEVFKRPVLWDNRLKGYHNRDLIDSEWKNLSQTLGISSKYYYIAFLFGLYTILCTDM